MLYNCTKASGLIFFLGGKRWIPLSDIFADGVGNNTIMPEEVLVSVRIPHSRKVSHWCV